MLIDLITVPSAVVGSWEESLSTTFGRPVVTSEEREIDNHQVRCSTFLNIKGVSIYPKRKIKESARMGSRIGSICPKTFCFLFFVFVLT